MRTRRDASATPRGLLAESGTLARGSPHQSEGSFVSRRDTRPSGILCTMMQMSFGPDDARRETSGTVAKSPQTEPLPVNAHQGLRCVAPECGVVWCGGPLRVIPSASNQITIVKSSRLSEPLQKESSRRIDR